MGRVGWRRCSRRLEGGGRPAARRAACVGSAGVGLTDLTAVGLRAKSTAFPRRRATKTSPSFSCSWRRCRWFEEL